jgi:hypothetical protein
MQGQVLRMGVRSCNRGSPNGERHPVKSRWWCCSYLDYPVRQPPGERQQGLSLAAVAEFLARRETGRADQSKAANGRLRDGLGGPHQWGVKLQVAERVGAVPILIHDPSSVRVWGEINRAL